MFLLLPTRFCVILIKLCIKNIIYDQNYQVRLIFPFHVMYIIEAVAQQPWFKLHHVEVTVDFMVGYGTDTLMIPCQDLSPDSSLLWGKRPARPDVSQADWRLSWSHLFTVGIHRHYDLFFQSGIQQKFPKTSHNQQHWE